ncbi:MAG TPA: hypothetical protein VH500_09690 [Nitrososphaeraceae archaeon]
MLSSEEISRCDILLSRFRNEPISKDDAQELKLLLENEKEYAVEAGDILLVFGISLLISLVVEYL